MRRFLILAMFAFVALELSGCQACRNWHAAKRCNRGLAGAACCPAPACGPCSGGTCSPGTCCPGPGAAIPGGATYVPSGSSYLPQDGVVIPQGGTMVPGGPAYVPNASCPSCAAGTGMSGGYVVPPPAVIPGPVIE